MPIEPAEWDLVLRRLAAKDGALLKLLADRASTPTIATKLRRHRSWVWRRSRHLHRRAHLGL
jgi:hypothetical protein